MCNTSAGIDDSERKKYHITLNLHEQSLLGEKSQSVFDERWGHLLENINFGLYYEVKRLMFHCGTGAFALYSGECAIATFTRWV